MTCITMRNFPLDYKIPLNFIKYTARQVAGKYPGFSSSPLNEDARRNIGDYIALTKSYVEATIKPCAALLPTREIRHAKRQTNSTHQTPLPDVYHKGHGNTSETRVWTSVPSSRYRRGRTDWRACRYWLCPAAARTPSWPSPACWKAAFGPGWAHSPAVVAWDVMARGRWNRS